MIHTNNKLIIWVTFFLFMSSIGVLNAQNFTEHTINGNFNGATDIFVIDLDEDGDLDILATARNADDVTWFENGGNENFTEHTIAANFNGAQNVTAIDLDADGDLDVLATAVLADQVVWFENDGNENFTQRNIDPSLNGALDINALDLDGDGDIDIVATASVADDVVWYENDGSQTFTKHIIDANFDKVQTAVPLDFDGDGDVDIVSVAEREDEVVWYENDGSQVFTKNIINGNFNGAKAAFVIDLDGDSDLDVVGTAKNADDVTWFENNGSQNFTEHTIKGNFDGASSVFAIDVNNDGDIDVVAAAENADDIMWFENDGNQNFTEHTIIGNFDNPRTVFAVDLDGDNDVDVLGAAFNADDLTWWESDLAISPDFVVVNTNDTGAGSLRQAILNANAAAGSTIIQFNIPGAGAHTISLQSPLPVISGSLIIDATTQADFLGNPLVELDGSGQNTGDILNLNGLSGLNIIKGLIINGSPNNGISINNCLDVEINNCLIGTNAVGTAAILNNANGILISNSTATIIDQCTLSGNNQNGLSSSGTSGSSIIRNCKIGVNATATAALANATHGIHLNGGGNNTIGGSSISDRNIISGNANDGIRISSSSNTIINNFIGTDVTGNVDLGNAANGLLLDGSSIGNLIGTASAGNVISANNSDGIEGNAIGNGSATKFQNNIIGLNAAATGILPNTLSGIRLLANASNIDIGGSLANQGNIIAGNGQDGIIAILTDGTNIDIFGNTIGITTGGMLNLGNTGAGIHFVGANHFVVGGNENRANTIAFNGDNGIKIDKDLGSSTASQDIELTRNIIFDNTTKGIFHTAIQNAVATPILTSATVALVFTVKGTLTGNPNATYKLEFFKNTTANSSANHEGKVFISSANITTDGMGNALINEILNAQNVGEFITATATENNKNTSEFSNGIEVFDVVAPVNDNCVGAIPITPSTVGTGCGAATFTLAFTGDGTTDSGVPLVCTTPGNDQWFTWTASTLELLFNSLNPGRPGIAIFATCADGTAGNEITCFGPIGVTDLRLSGWNLGDNLLIQIFDSQGASSDVAFCLEEFEPMINDNCSVAIPITPSPAGSGCASPSFILPFIADNATDSGVATVCNIPGKDGWFTWTATTDKLLFNSGSPGNPGIAVFANCVNAEAGMEVDCANTFATNAILEGWSIGDDLFIQIYDSQGDPLSDVAFCLEEVVPPVNDNCAGAVPIVPSLQGTGCNSAGFTLPFTIDGTTDSGVPTVCNEPGLDQWFTWTATAPKLSFNSLNPGGPGIAIFANCADALTGNEIDCINTATSVGRLDGWDLGDELLIQIFDFQGALSNVAFCLEEFTPPVNDICSGAIPITPSPEGTGCSSAGFTFPFSTDSTTDSGVPQVCVNPGKDQWFTWTASSINLLFNSLNPGGPGIAIFANCADALAGIDLDCANTNTSNNVLGGWNLGDNLIIQIYDFQNSNSNVAFCLEEFIAPPPAVNDNCAGAIPITPSVDGTGCDSPTFVLPFLFDNTTDSGVPSVCSTPGKDQWFTWTATSLELIFNSENPGAPGIAIFANCADAEAGTDIDCADPNASNDFLSGWSLDDELLIQIYDRQGSNSDVAFCLKTFDRPAPPVNDLCAGAIPITPSAQGTGCDAPSFLLPFSTDGTTDSGVPTVCVNAGNDQWFTWTATSTHLIFTSNNPGNPGIAIFANCGDALAGIDIDCANTGANFNLLSGWEIGDVLLIQIYDSSFSNSDVAFCLEILNVPPLTNDECVDAIALIVNPGTECNDFVTASIVDATESPEFESCDFSRLAFDVWFSFVATATRHEIQISNIQGPDIPFYQIREGADCGDSFEIDCDQFPESGTTVINGLHIGETYFVRIGSAFTAFPRPFVFDICILTPEQPPINDEPSNAIFLDINPDFSCDLFTSGTLVNSSRSSEFENCSGIFRHDVWYVFQATSTFHRIDVSNITGPNGNLLLQLLELGEAGLTQIGCGNNSSGINANGLFPGVFYFVRLGTESTEDAQLTTFDVCVSSQPPPPANDACEAAILLIPEAAETCINTVSATLHGATESNNPLNCFFTDYRDDIWFQFVATAAGHSIQISNIIEEKFGTISTTDLQFQLAEGSCGALTQLFCHDDPDNTIFMAGLTIGNTYFIRVASKVGLGIGRRTTTFDICIGTPAAAPPNDECIDAIPLTVSPDLNCNTFVSGTVLNATNSPLADDCSNFSPYDHDVWFTFVATNEDHDIFISNIVGSEPSLKYEILEGICSEATNFDCFDVPNSADNIHRIYGFTVGETYLIRANARSSDPESTTFDICIGTPPPPPVNDECTGAIVLSVNPDPICTDLVSGTFFTATKSPEIDRCDGVFDDDIWYSFVASDLSHTVNVTNIVGSQNDLVFEVLEGNICGTLNSIKCHDDAIPQNDIFTLTNLTPNNTYFIRGATASSQERLSTTFDICVNTPLTNKKCVDAKAVPVGIGGCLLIRASTAFTNDSNKHPACDNIGVNLDLWYNFQASASGQIEFDIFDGTSGAIVQAAIWENCGGLPGDEVFCTDDINLGDRVNGLAPGDTYFIQFWDDEGSTIGDFQFCVFDPSLDIASGTLGFCENIGTFDLAGFNFIDITSANGDIVCSINPNGNNLGQTTVDIFTTAQDREFSGIMAMRRDITITSTTQPLSPVSIRMYYTAEELNALITADPDINTAADINLTRASLPCTGGLAGGSLVPQLSHGNFGTQGDVFIQIQTSSFSTFFAHGNQALLPVELIAFTAHLLDKKIQLDWATATEVNNKGFALERWSKNTLAKQIAFITGEGTTSFDKHYSFIDDKIVAGTTYFYRLKQIDFDGQFSYSNIITASIKGDDSIGTAFYPNPASDRAILPHLVNNFYEIKITVYDALGRTIPTLPFYYQNRIELDIHRWKAGIYHISIEVEGRRYKRSLAVVK